MEANDVKTAEDHGAFAASAAQEVIHSTDHAAATTLIGSSASKLLSNDSSYHNAKRQVTIANNYYTFLRVISNLCGVSISQMINNMLQPYFDNKALMKEMKSLATEKYRENINVIDSHL
jgi:hypothetical protein